MVRKLVVLFVISLLVAACNPPSPSAPLRVNARVPAANAVDVPLDATVSVTFNQAVNASTVVADNFTLTSGADDALVEVPGDVAYDAASHTATFTPADPLLPATVYTATVTTDVTTADGRSLSGDLVWSFTTVDPTEPEPTAPTVSIVEGDQLLTMADDPVQLTAETDPADAVVTWSSSDEDVVTVDDTGLVTVVGPGTATVTAEVAGAEAPATVEVTVAPPLVAALTDVVVTDFDAYIDDLITIPAPELTSPGYGAVTWSITAGAFPPPFSVVAEPVSGHEYADVYELTLDEDTGEVTGSTGYPGVFEWTLTGTDELGQTVSVDYVLELGVSLQYVRPIAEEPVTTVPVTTAQAGGVVVQGDRVRLSGVRNTLDLEEEFLALFSFALNDEVNFDINTADGAITYIGDTPGTYVVTVTVTYSGDAAAPLTDTHVITFEVTGPV